MLRNGIPATETKQFTHSIILVYCNDSQQDSLLSCLEQFSGNRNCELIICDDGCRIPASHVVSKVTLRSAPVRVLRQDRRGSIAACNLGLTHSRGRITTFFALNPTCQQAEPDALELDLAESSLVTMWSDIALARCTSKNNPGMGRQQTSAMAMSTLTQTCTHLCGLDENITSLSIAFSDYCLRAAAEYGAQAITNQATRIAPSRQARLYPITEQAAELTSRNFVKLRYAPDNRIKTTARVRLKTLAEGFMTSPLRQLASAVAAAFRPPMNASLYAQNFTNSVLAAFLATPSLLFGRPPKHSSCITNPVFETASYEQAAQKAA